MITSSKIIIRRGQFAPDSAPALTPQLGHMPAYIATCEADCLSAVDLSVYRLSVKHGKEIILDNESGKGFSSGTPIQSNDPGKGA